MTKDTTALKLANNIFLGVFLFGSEEEEQIKIAIVRAIEEATLAERTRWICNVQELKNELCLEPLNGIICDGSCIICRAIDELIKKAINDDTQDTMSSISADDKSSTHSGGKK